MLTMDKVWPRYIYDPAHKLIAFNDTATDRLLLNLIDCREFQRLRRIKQLGMSELVFPGTNHSRFAHSVGVSHIARLMLTRLKRVMPGKIKPVHESIILSGALLHDVGHGPFSHAFEKITSDNHEQRTREIILDKSTQIHKCLAAFERGLPAKLALFFEEDISDKTLQKKAGIPPVLAQIISSQLDADRLDYLVRDTHSAGTEYGKVDIDWLISQLRVDTKKHRLYLTRKGLMVAEAYVLARHHMYQTVYFHKTTRAAEVMLYLVFQRFRDLLKKVGRKRISRIVIDVPSKLTKAFAGPLSLSDYLELDDHCVVVPTECSPLKRG